MKNAFMAQLKASNGRKLTKIELVEGVAVYIPHYSISEFSALQLKVSPADKENETEAQAMERLVNLFLELALDDKGNQMFPEITPDLVEETKVALSLPQMRMFLAKIAESQGVKSNDATFPVGPA